MALCSTSVSATAIHMPVQPLPKDVWVGVSGCLPPPGNLPHSANAVRVSTLIMSRPISVLPMTPAQIGVSMFLAQHGRTPQTAQLVNKTWHMLPNQETLQCQKVPLPQPSRQQVGQTGASGFPTVHCNMSLLVVVAGATTIRARVLIRIARAGAFGCPFLLRCTLLSAKAAPASRVTTTWKDASTGASGYHGLPGRTLRNASDAPKSHQRLGQSCPEPS
mmetsp:Transcript_73190/g.89827  ORF Transcript_73190/g.89827 Transcript_73190/m.89827 type:complete len:219 (+) Transcript_73190:157-813(+)